MHPNELVPLPPSGCWGGGFYRSPGTDPLVGLTEGIGWPDWERTRKGVKWLKQMAMV